jgi:hypothetical protein
MIVICFVQLVSSTRAWRRLHQEMVTFESLGDRRKKVKAVLRQTLHSIQDRSPMSMVVG